LEQIKKNDSLSADFYASVIRCFDVIMQIRSSGAVENISDLNADFIHSPVEPFFDSRKYKKLNSAEAENIIEMPTS